MILIVDVILRIFNYYSGLRRRGTNKQSEMKKEVCSGQQEETSHKSKTDHTENQDPLKWFGILVPQNLKQAQSSFKQGEIDE